MNDIIFCIDRNQKGSVHYMDNIKKNIVLRVEPSFHQQVKLYVTLNNTTLQEYIVGLIKKDMEQNKQKESE